MNYADPVEMVRSLAPPHISTVKVLTSNDRGAVKPPPEGDGQPLAHVFALNGVEGAVDRIDRVQVDVYAPIPEKSDSPTAIGLASEICTALSGGPHDTRAGYIDSVWVEQVPVLRALQEGLDYAQAVYSITHRPQI